MSDVPEGVLNLLEMIVRCFDCWLSCAAHITVVDAKGSEIYSRELNVGLGWTSNKKRDWTRLPLCGLIPTTLLFFI